MNDSRVNVLLKKGYLWNISGISNYFLELYSRPDFNSEYDVLRKKYVLNTEFWQKELIRIPDIKCFTSYANFVLIELPLGMNSFDLTMNLLIENGIYVRDCSDKLGLNGNFVRVASRTFEENLYIIDGLKQTLLNL